MAAKRGGLELLPAVGSSESEQEWLAVLQARFDSIGKADVMPIAHPRVVSFVSAARKIADSKILLSANFLKHLCFDGLYIARDKVNPTTEGWLLLAARSRQRLRMSKKMIILHGDSNIMLSTCILTFRQPLPSFLPLGLKLLPTMLNIRSQHLLPSLQRVLYSLDRP